MEALGSRRMVKLAERWSGETAVTAAAILKRADVGKFFSGTSGVPGAGRLIAGEKLRKAEAHNLKLPEEMLLVLDATQTLSLLRMKGLVMLRPHSDPLRHWPVGEVRVVIHEGRGFLRPFEIIDGEQALMTAALWRPEAQREALRLIERTSAA